MVNNYKSVQYFLHICQLFGVAPIYSPPNRNVFYKVARVCHILWSCCMLFMVAWGKYREYYDYLVKNDIIVRFFVLVEHAFDLTNCAIAIIGANYYSHLYARYKDRFNAIDQQFDQPTSIDKQLSRYLYSFCLYLSICILLFEAGIVFFHKTPLEMYFATCTYVLPNLMIMMVVGKYLSVMYISRVWFECIVCELKTIETRINNASCISEKGSKSTDYINSTMDRINKLRNVYYDVCSLATDLNDNIAWLLTGVIATALCVVTGQSFTMYLLISRRMTRISVYIFAILWSVANFVKIVILLSSNAQLMWQVIRIVEFSSNPDFMK